MIMIEKVPYSHEMYFYNLFVCFKKMRTYKNFMSLPIVDALAHAANNDVPTPLSEVVLAAPDVDKDVFLSWCIML
jgi:hypothetical protein